MENRTGLALLFIGVLAVAGVIGQVLWLGDFHLWMAWPVFGLIVVAVLKLKDAA